VAVLTSIDDTDARAVLAEHGLGALRRWEGIAGGSVNSNFALESVGSAEGEEGVRVFLRLYEEQDFGGAERETAILERLARAGVPTPPPLRRVDGTLVSRVRGKPAAVFPWREGAIRCQASVTPDDTRLVGEALARVHLAGAEEAIDPGRFRFEDLRRRLDRIASSADDRFAPLAAPLRDALTRVHAARDPQLPHGLIHSDLFRDNVLWGGGAANDRLVALLDFESACRGTYVYDLMVTMLSWCFGDGFEARLATALRAGYESVRPLAPAEKEALCVEGSFGALRFTITRITDYAMRTSAAGPRSIKDWRRFMKRFEELQSLGPPGVRELMGAR
jgi:homoserine kinase type II